MRESSARFAETRPGHPTRPCPLESVNCGPFVGTAKLTESLSMGATNQELRETKEGAGA